MDFLEVLIYILIWMAEAFAYLVKQGSDEPSTVKKTSGIDDLF